MGGRVTVIDRRMFSRGALVLLGGASALGVERAEAEDAAASYPTHPVNVVCPWAAGGSTDAFARVLCARLSADLGKPFVVENRTGASGTIGMLAAARMRTDGYNLVIAPGSTWSIAPNLYPLQYDTQRDFVGVGLLATMPIFALVPRNSPIRSIADYVAMVKRPGHREVYANPGSGSTPHLAAEMFLQAADIQVTDVGYRGGGPAVQGVLAGEAGLIFQPAASVLSFMQSGDLRAIGVTARQRTPVAPDVPTFAEAGYPDVDVGEDVAMLAPTGTPAAILARLHAACSAALAAAEVRERLAVLGVTPAVRPMAEWPGFLAADTAKWRDVIRQRNIHL